MSTLQRYLKTWVLQDLKDKIVFIGGPRQVGKTTFAQSLLKDFRHGHPACLNWDAAQDRRIINTVCSDIKTGAFKSRRLCEGNHTSLCSTAAVEAIPISVLSLGIKQTFSKANKMKLLSSHSTHIIIYYCWTLNFPKS
jgi:hypothetical protein